ncbi:conserved hypothetical protein [Streptomyces clavuligerus]|nr:conserved hypothetical protein [Streptomyces clavuligerus]
MAADPIGVGGQGRIAMTADGAYAARLAGDGEALFAERWTLGGPEPYAVPLPLGRPEERNTGVLPLGDGRVLIRRREAGRHMFSLVYPVGPGTGELSLGGIETPWPALLLPPSPDGARAYVVVPGPRTSTIWLVAGGGYGPEPVAEVPGHCSGGVWLDRTGRMLALDRREADGGPVKTVAVDLARGGEATPLLQITADSQDRLLLADPDSGLLLIRSDAAGHERVGWGVLGSDRPVRFPECLRLPQCAVTPFAVQPGQALVPESSGVALRIEGPAGSWLGVWRPSGRRLHQLAAPQGWLTGTGLWSGEGVLRLPYATGAEGCGMARVDAAAIFAREAAAHREAALRREAAMYPYPSARYPAPAPSVPVPGVSVPAPPVSVPAPVGPGSMPVPGPVPGYMFVPRVRSGGFRAPSGADPGRGAARAARDAARRGCAAVPGGDDDQAPGGGATAHGPGPGGAPAAHGGHGHRRPPGARDLDGSPDPHGPRGPRAADESLRDRTRSVRRGDRSLRGGGPAAAAGARFTHRAQAGTAATGAPRRAAGASLNSAACVSDQQRPRTHMTGEAPYV